jgi:hypothetical protein
MVGGAARRCAVGAADVRTETDAASPRGSHARSGDATEVEAVGADGDASHRVAAQ